MTPRIAQYSSTLIPLFADAVELIIGKSER